MLSGITAEREDLKKYADMKTETKEIQDKRKKEVETVS